MSCLSCGHDDDVDDDVHVVQYLYEKTDGWMTPCKTPHPSVDVFLSLLLAPLPSQCINRQRNVFLALVRVRRVFLPDHGHVCLMLMVPLPKSRHLAHPKENEEKKGGGGKTPTTTTISTSTTVTTATISATTVTFTSDPWLVPFHWPKLGGTSGGGTSGRAGCDDKKELYIPKYDIQLPPDDAGSGGYTMMFDGRDGSLALPPLQSPSSSPALDSLIDSMLDEKASGRRGGEAEEDSSERASPPSALPSTAHTMSSPPAPPQVLSSPIHTNIGTYTTSTTTSASEFIEWDPLKSATPPPPSYKPQLSPPPP